MIIKTYMSKGANNFKGFTFSANEWSAPTMVSPTEIKEYVKKFNLIGRKVKNIRIIGLSYFHTRSWIEDAVYRQLDNLPEEERQRKSNYASIDSTVVLARSSQIDEPLLIRFEDDDTFEMDTPQQPEFRMSMNCIPWHIEAGTNLPNVNADILFEPCLGQAIVDVEVNTYLTDIDPMFHEPFDGDHTKRELVSDIVLRLENGFGLRIGGRIDFCEVDCIDNGNNIVDIPFGKLKPALFNWEDLHFDETVGFKAESPTLFFGKKGADHTCDPFMTLSSTGNKATSLHISVDDFLLLSWCLTYITGDCFDEYGEYRFTREQWNEILCEAEKILAFESFDDLFDYTVDWKINYCPGNNCMLVNMNCSGADYWEHRDKYRKQIKDIREWSELVLNSGDMMDVYGF